MKRVSDLHKIDMIVINIPLEESKVLKYNKIHFE